MENVIYITIEEALGVYRKTIECSGGGMEGVIDDGKLKAALDFVQNDDYYPTFEEKLVYLIYSVNRNHAFEDGNKRLSITLGGDFLLRNGYLYCLRRYFTEMENISYHLAAGRIDKELLSKLVHSFLENEEDFSEELKMELYEAISDSGDETEYISEKQAPL